MALAPGVYSDVNIQNVRIGAAVTLASATPDLPAAYNVTVASFSGTVTITSADPSHPAVFAGFNIAGSSGLTFSNLDFSTAGVTTPAAFRVSSSQNLTFTNLNVYGSAASWNTVEGFLIRGSSNVTVSNSNFSQLWNGIAEMGNSGVDISNNAFQLITGDGIDNASSQNVAIVGNSFTNFEPNGSEHPDAIQFWTAGTTVPGEHILIKGNTISRGAGQPTQGIFVTDQTGDTPYADLVISHNTITGELYNAITVGGAHDVLVCGNTVTAYTDQQSFIYLLDDLDGSLQNNLTESYKFKNNRGLVSVDNLFNQAIAPQSVQTTTASASTTFSASMGAAGFTAAISTMAAGGNTLSSCTASRLVTGATGPTVVRPLIG